MNSLKIAITFCFCLSILFSESQEEKKFYEKIHFGMVGTIGIPLGTVNTKEYYLAEGEPLIHGSGENEPLYGAGFKLAYELTSNQSLSINHNAFVYNYESFWFGLNQFPSDRWNYEFSLGDFTEFYFNAFHINYRYNLNLGMVKPFVGIGLGHYWVKTLGYGNIVLSDSLLIREVLYDLQDEQQLRYFNLKPEFGFDLLFNQYFGMSIFGNFDIPLTKPIHYNFNYDSITEQTEFVTRVDRIFSRLNMFTFGIGMFFYLPETKKTSK